MSTFGAPSATKKVAGSMRLVGVGAFPLPHVRRVKVPAKQLVQILVKGGVALPNARGIFVVQPRQVTNGKAAKEVDVPLPFITQAVRPVRRQIFTTCLRPAQPLFNTFRVNGLDELLGSLAGLTAEEVHIGVFKPSRQDVLKEEFCFVDVCGD